MARAMKDSGIAWIGEIPRNWKLFPLKGVSERNIVGLATSVTQYYREMGTPIFRNLNIKEDKLLDDDLLFLDEEWASLQQGKMIRTGDILTVHTGYIGISCIVPEKYNKALTFTTLITTPKDTVINRRFLMWYINVSRFFSPVFFNVETGAQNNLNTKAFVNLEICVPDLSEQNRITAYLDRKCAEIDAVIEQTRASIEEYKALKQSIITEAVTKGIRRNRPMKDSGIAWIGEIPEEWETVKVKYVADLILNSWSDCQQDLAYIGLENIVSWTGQHIKTNSNYDKSQSIVFGAGDVLFGKLRPYLAKVFLAPKEGCCSGEFCVFRPNDSVYGMYLWALMISRGFIFEVDRSTYGTKMPRANADFIKNMFVPVPPVCEQTEIADFIRKRCVRIDELIAEKTSLLAQLESYKKSVIYEYVTGKKEVPVCQ